MVIKLKAFNKAFVVRNVNSDQLNKGYATFEKAFIDSTTHTLDTIIVKILSFVNIVEVIIE